MKTTICLFFLALTFVGCNEADKVISESKTCTFNGNPISCEELESYQNSLENHQSENSNEIQVSAKIIAKYTINGNIITITEGAKKTTEKIAKNKRLSCTANLETNLQLEADADEKGLTLYTLSHSDSIYLERMTNLYLNTPILGSFLGYDKGNQDQIRFTFDPKGNVELETICNFNLN